MTLILSRRRILNRVALVATALAATLIPFGASTAVASAEPISAARFSITVDGYEIASFSERAEAPAGASMPMLVLKRSSSPSQALWAWHEAGRNGVMGYRRDVVVVVFDSSGHTVARYYLENAWPSKIEIGSLKSGSSEVMMETITLAYEQFKVGY